MAEDSSLDILGAKPVAKAIEKVTEGVVDGLGSFFGAICMPAAEEFGMFLREKVAAFRTKNLESIAKKTKTKMEQLKLSPTGDASPLLMKQIMDDASWIDDSAIQAMWAGLLAVAASQSLFGAPLQG